MGSFPIAETLLKTAGIKEAEGVSALSILRPDLDTKAYETAVENLRAREGTAIQLMQQNQGVDPTMQQGHQDELDRTRSNYMIARQLHDAKAHGKDSSIALKSVNDPALAALVRMPDASTSLEAQDTDGEGKPGNPAEAAKEEVDRAHKGGSGDSSSAKDEPAPSHEDVAASGFSKALNGLDKKTAGATMYENIPALMAAVDQLSPEEMTAKHAALVPVFGKEAADAAFENLACDIETYTVAAHLKHAGLIKEAIADLPMGDMNIVDRGDLGIDFNDRMDDDKLLTFVNAIGAKKLGEWLAKRQEERGPEALEERVLARTDGTKEAKHKDMKGYDEKRETGGAYKHVKMGAEVYDGLIRVFGKEAADEAWEQTFGKEASKPEKGGEPFETQPQPATQPENRKPDATPPASANAINPHPKRKDGTNFLPENTTGSPKDVYKNDAPVLDPNAVKHVYDRIVPHVEDVKLDKRGEDVLDLLCTQAAGAVKAIHGEKAAATASAGITDMRFGAPAAPPKPKPVVAPVPAATAAGSQLVGAGAPNVNAGM